ncbi:ankyrin repeat domain-containing protein [Amycolatopsis sp. NBC_01480]|uniref:ankyrin repeat domain-containing protein n=1 Tax=Amycolatopsis sp. NBC_01480 TaxID=2903562 RepID=UPI002E284353|nr:ankyrin repeat domain-containing protein [Amycolatopsis sp. NBC_01480]
MTELDREGRDLLHYAAKNDDVAGVQDRLAAGVDVNLAESRSQYTPLHFAVQDGAVNAARALLETGADVQAVYSPGATPLHLAVIRWRKSPDGTMIKLLLEHGADTSAPEKNGRTPAEIAKGQYEFPDELAEMLQR